MGHIFISYRRDDSAGHAGRLEEALEARFGVDAVFRDVDDLVPGLSFSAALQSRLEAADVVLVLIGPNWLDAERGGQRRIDQPDDYVRLEVAHALASGKPVIPVLLGGAILPRAEQLPESLRPLVERHAVRVDDEGWQDDVARLSKALTAWIPERVGARRSRPPSWAMGGLVVLAMLFLAWPAPTPFPSGGWTAEVRYDWGPVVTERFVLTLRGKEVVGWASFLAVPRPIVDARWADGVLTLETRSESQMGDDTRVLHHRYRVQRDEHDRYWRVDYLIDGGFTPVKPMEFELRQADEVAS